MSLAHTRTLGPNEEMLRILEAMGILALVTRHTPKDIADERERIQEMLDCHLQFSDESQQKMLGYVHFIESRLSELPSEIEAGLGPQQIAKILGESLRQHFVQSGIPDTVAGLQATTAAMGNVQKRLSAALLDLTDRDGGVAAKYVSDDAYWALCRDGNSRVQRLGTRARNAVVAGINHRTFYSALASRTHSEHPGPTHTGTVF